MKKRILAALLCSAIGVSALATLAGCGSEPATEPTSEPAASEAESKAEEPEAAVIDKEAVQEYVGDGKMTIGITYFEPMNYLDENGDLTGFETEFAQAVCEKLGVEAEFQKIEWKTKEVELNAKTIDCIWNGLTITEERQQNMDISIPYMENKQVLVVKADNAEKYADPANWVGVTTVAEKESAGEEVAATLEGVNYTGVDSQAKALMEVKTNQAEIAVIDYVMSIGTLTGESDYSDLKVVEGQEFGQEQYGIALRKGSDKVTASVNAAIEELAKEGKLNEIATKYNLQDLMLVK